MSEIYDNLNPKIASHIDSRLSTVATASSLLSPLDATNFLYEGAVAYVSDEQVNYMVETVGGSLTWVKQGDSSLVRGTLTINPSVTEMNMALVVPDISTCYAVDITITGSSATIAKISNFPGNNQNIEFRVENGKSITFTHSDYSSVNDGSIVIEDGFDMTIKGRSVGDEFVVFEKNGVAVVQRSSVQFMKRDEWLTDLLDATIVDNLTSTSASESLSANQGRVLNASLSNKQDTLTVSDNLSITGDTIKGVPNPWIGLSSPPSSSSIVDAETFIMSNYGGLSIDYVNFRRLDLSNYSDGDYGKWVLPPGASPSIISQWIEYDRPLPSTGFCQYTYKSSSTLSSDSVGTSYHPRILLNSKVGSNLDVAFNNDGSANEGVSMQFLRKGLYTVRSTIALLGESSAVLDAISKMRGVITVTNGIRGIANPALGGIVNQSLQFPYFDYTVSSTSLVHLILEATINVDTPGTLDAFTISINNQGESFTDVQFPQDSSVLRITKHK